uniref:Uncharacterized protein n=1 Tax=Lepeophtheirus salmonis TaxID=72036 RepID=A0A0K2T7X6_LEPSM
MSLGHKHFKSLIPKTNITYAVQETEGAGRVPQGSSKKITTRGSKTDSCIRHTKRLGQHCGFLHDHHSPLLIPRYGAYHTDPKSKKWSSCWTTS